jgi:type I restriction enzyme S subunit
MTDFVGDGLLECSGAAQLDVEAKQLQSRRLQPGDIVLEKSGGGQNQPVGRVALFEADDGEPYSFSNFTAAIRVIDPSVLDFRYLHKYLYWLHLSGQTAGMQSHSTNIRNLRMPTYKGQLIPVPSPHEQLRIAEALDRAFDAVAVARKKVERNLLNAQELLASELDAAVRGLGHSRTTGDASVKELLEEIEEARTRAAAEGRAKRLKAAVEPAASAGPFPLPAHWVWRPLGSLTVGISDGVHSTPKYIADGVPFVTVRNLTAGPGISLEDVRFISQEDHAEFIKRTHPERGDILISKDGTIGVVRRIETDVDFSIFVSVALVKPALPQIGQFLTYALSAPSIQSQMVPQGAALKHIYLTDLRQLPMPVPPVSEQQRIAARLDAITEAQRSLEAVYQQKLAALDELKRSLLYEAFAGRLANNLS